MDRPPLSTFLGEDARLRMQLRADLKPERLWENMHPSWKGNEFENFEAKLHRFKEDPVYLRSWLALRSPWPAASDPLSSFQAWLLQCSAAALDKLLLAAGLILMETPALLLVRPYRDPLQATLSAEELERLIQIWPGKSKPLSPNFLAEGLVLKAQAEALCAMESSFGSDAVWRMLTLRRPRPTSKLRPRSIPLWWHPHWLKHLEEHLA